MDGIGLASDLPRSLPAHILRASPRERRAADGRAAPAGGIAVHREPRPPPLANSGLPSVTALADHLADHLARDAAALGAHWQDRARAAVPRPPDRPPMADAALAERIVASLAASLPDGSLWQDALMRAGWEMGTTAQGSGFQTDALLTEVDLLMAIVLYAAERHVDALDVPHAVATTPPAETFAAVRRLHEAISLLSLAATRGYVHAQQDRLRSHYRALRHDLRNPIGTIQSAAALMQDASLPPDQRADPRYAEMVVRNAQSLEDMITSHLGDESTGETALQAQVSVRDLALAVRRAARAEAERAECRVEVDDDMPEVRAAVGALELTLRSLLTATIAALPLGSAIHITGSVPADGRLRVALLTHPPLAHGERVLQAARGVAEIAGATLGSDSNSVWAEIPAVAVSEGATA